MAFGFQAENSLQLFLLPTGYGKYSVFFTWVASKNRNRKYVIKYFLCFIYRSVGSGLPGGTGQSEAPGRTRFELFLIMSIIFMASYISALKMPIGMQTRTMYSAAT
jgi:hypothetical protein